MLETEGFEVIGEAADGASAIATAERLRPELVLLDVMLPDHSGFSVARCLGLLRQPPRVILMSSRVATDFGDVGRHADGVGFVPKQDLSGPRLRAMLE